MRVCSIDGCDGPHYGRGWCKPHYMRWYQYGDPVRQPAAKRVCSVDGCDRWMHGHGLCSLHLRRWQKRGRLDILGNYQCTICTHANRAGIELAYSGGAPMGEVAEMAGCTTGSVRIHARHAGVADPKRRTGKRCLVCDHDDVIDIEKLLLQRQGYDRGGISGPNPDCPDHLYWTSIARTYGVTVSSLRYHMKPRHMERRAQFQIARLAALKATA